MDLNVGTINSNQLTTDLFSAGAVTTWKTRLDVQIILSYLKGASDHVIQVETDVEMMFKDERDNEVFTAAQHKI